MQRPVGGGPEEVVWHWYFKDSAPDSVDFTELNGDGLWDMRVFMGGTAKPIDLLQREAFSLLGPPLPSPVAENGESSAPADLWKCFDGDTSTVWQSTAPKTYIELPNPLGAPMNELDLQMTGKKRPKKIDVFAGDSKVQTLDLAETDEVQRFHLDARAVNAPSIRIETKASADAPVEIRELQIR